MWKWTSTKGGEDEAAGRIDRVRAASPAIARSIAAILPSPDRDTEAIAAVGQCGVADNEVEHHAEPTTRGPRLARACRRPRQSLPRRRTPPRSAPASAPRAARPRRPAAPVHDHDAVGEARGQRQIVHDRQHRAAACAAAQKLHHHELMARIEREPSARRRAGSAPRMASARASATRARSPPDSVVTARSAKPRSRSPPARGRRRRGRPATPRMRRRAVRGRAPTTAATGIGQWKTWPCGR